jgi:hypothetical protein
LIHGNPPIRYVAVLELGATETRFSADKRVRRNVATALAKAQAPTRLEESQSRMD